MADPNERDTGSTLGASGPSGYVLVVCCCAAVAVFPNSDAVEVGGDWQGR